MAIPETPDHIIKLANTILTGMGLDERFLQRYRKKLLFGDFDAPTKVEGYENEEVVADICNDMPFLAALILVGKTTGKIIEEDMMPNREEEVIFFISVANQIGKLLWEVAKLVALKHPGMEAVGLRCQDGRLVLTAFRHSREELLMSAVLASMAKKLKEVLPPGLMAEEEEQPQERQKRFSNGVGLLDFVKAARF